MNVSASRTLLGDVLNPPRRSLSLIFADERWFCIAILRYQAQLMSLGNGAFMGNTLPARQFSIERAALKLMLPALIANY